MRGALLVLLALLAPLAAAHGDGKEETYDPLAFDLLLFARGPGALVQERPDPATIPFQSGEPNAPHPPLDFTFTSPARLRLDQEARVTFGYSVKRPHVPGDSQGDSFEITLLHEGQPTNATTKVKLPQTSALVATGRQAFEVTLPLAGLLVEPGQTLGLRVRPLMPIVPPDALHLVVGGRDVPMPPPNQEEPPQLDETYATRIFLPSVRVPTVADLQLQDAPAEEFLLAADPGYRTGAATVYFELRVDHNRTELGPLQMPEERRAFLILRGAESSADAHAFHHALDPRARAEAAHHYQVGDRLVRVHPGVGVRVPLSPGPDGLNVVVKCVHNCPPGGFERTIPLLKPDDPLGATGGTLIPPPRSTKGIPVSEDAPVEEEKNFMPTTGSGFVAGVVALAALAARRQTKGKP